MDVTRITSGLYRIDEGRILFRKPSRSLRLTKTNRHHRNATVKCETWVIMKTPLDDADILETLEITAWRRCPGDEIGEYETKAEALEAVGKESAR